MEAFNRISIGTSSECLKFLKESFGDNPPSSKPKIIPNEHLPKTFKELIISNSISESKLKYILF